MRIALGLVGLIYGAGSLVFVVLGVYYGSLALYWLHGDSTASESADGTAWFAWLAAYLGVLLLNAALLIIVAYALLAAKRWACRLVTVLNVLYLLLFAVVISPGLGNAIRSPRVSEAVVVFVTFGFLLGIIALCKSNRAGQVLVN
jgi:hypothetical protein